jgi:hypothetical protein
VDLPKREKTPVFWAGLVVVAFSATALFSALWNCVFIYPLLTDPKFVLDRALGTGMQPRSILDGQDWSFFQAYSWLSYSEERYLLSDFYWKLQLPNIAGASAFLLIGLYMARSGVIKEEKERNSL